MRWRGRIEPAGTRGRLGRRGFTLVEILVSMAILAILTGVMMPLFGTVWLSNEQTETRQKMADLKRAMVGDQRLVQNGIRMHYGFVGDNGDLPYAIADLVSDSDSFVNWNGPYLVGAFDPIDYARDAWGHDLQYIRHNPPVEVGGQRIVANLTSLGPDGLPGTDDDLNEITDPELQILESEVWPTDKVEGNLDYIFTGPIASAANFSAKLRAVYNDSTGTGEAASECISFTPGEVATGESVRLRPPFSKFMEIKLPVGRVVVSSHLFETADCSGTAVPQFSEVAVFISDGLSAVAVNPPTLSYP